MPHECTLNRAFRLAGTNFGHLSSFAAADATSAFWPKADISWGDRIAYCGTVPRQAQATQAKERGPSGRLAIYPRRR